MKKTTQLLLLLFSLLVLSTIVALVIHFAYGNQEPILEFQPDIIYDETLVIVADKDFDPYSFFDENGIPTGHDIEVISLLADTMKMNVEIRLMEWSKAIEAVKNKEADVLLGLVYTPLELNKFQLSIPISTDSFVVFGEKDYEGLNSLYKKKLAILNGSDIWGLFIKPYRLEENTTAYDTYGEAFLSVENGHNDYVIATYSVGRRISAQYDVTAFGSTVVNNSFCIAAAADNVDLVEKINASILEMKSDGTLDALSKKWLGKYVEIINIGDFLKLHMLPFILILSFTFFTPLLFLIYMYRRRYQCVNVDLEMANAEMSQLLEMAKNASQAKSDFLANMSHEIRTPMNAIIGLNNIVQDTELTPYQRGMTNKIDFSASILLKLINDILDYSKVAAGKTELENTIFSLNAVLSNLSSIMADTIAAKGLNFTISTSANLPDDFKGDQLRLTQILLNLMSNALKFTDQGSIHLEIKSLGSDENEVDILFFKMTDTGIGIPPEAIDSLFQPFVQADISTTRCYGGTGLGLGLCQKLVELMGGTIWCESEVKRYSSFMFTVRLGHIFDSEIIIPKPEAEIKPVITKDLIEKLKGLRILMAEDNDLNQLVIKEFLKKVGLGVTIVENGRQVLDILDKEDFDMVLMDIQMPEMDGITATRLIRSHQRFKNLPIIAMTAHAMRGDRLKSLEAGMNEHITKPINPRIFFDCLLKWRYNIIQY